MTSQPRRSHLSAQGDTIRRAVRLYLEHAFKGQPPVHAARFLPPEGVFDPETWLMGDLVERTPPKAPLGKVRSFALRIGSSHYRHMKLRIARPGKQRALVFMVDCHDAFLEAPPGSADHEGLLELRRANAATASRIAEAWEAAGICTERSLIREKIQEVRRRAAGDTGA